MRIITSDRDFRFQSTLQSMETTTNLSCSKALADKGLCSDAFEFKQIGSATTTHPIEQPNFHFMIQTEMQALIEFEL
jgi:hypothetical protein